MRRDWTGPARTKSGVEWGEHTSAWSSVGGWVARKGQTGSEQEQPRCLGAALGQTGRGLVPNCAGQYAEEGAEEVTSGTYRAPQL